ncbi:hypothetical protein PF004_g7917, partial [Phytophthora fragariae]
MLAALRAYKTINGDTLVPQSFVVPSGDACWPRVAWGYALGGTRSLCQLCAIFTKYTATRMFRGRLIENAYARQVKESKEELKEMKLCFETIAERGWNEKILPALKVFRQVHHHRLVGSLFKVPHAAPWPEEAWGLRLGPIVSQVRFGSNYVELATRDKDILNEIGFAWDHDVSIWNERIIPALQAAWNMALGKQVYDMKYHGHYFSCIGRDIDRLKVLGFSFELRLQAWEKIVDPLLDIHESCFGDKAVPHDFVIPSQAPWPEKRWGV